MEIVATGHRYVYKDDARPVTLDRLGTYNELPSDLPPCACEKLVWDGHNYLCCDLKMAQTAVGFRSPSYDPVDLRKQNVAHLVTTRPDKEVAAEYRAKTETMLTVLVDMVNEASANGFIVGWVLGRDALGRYHVQTLEISKRM